MAKVLVADESFDYALLAGSSCAFGVFDGVHAGHRYLIDQAICTARGSGGNAIALTFDIDPDELFHSDRLKKLMSNEARLEMLASLPVDYVVALPFTPEFSAKGPAEFLQSIFGGNAPAHLHVGFDFRFGNRASGTVSDLMAWSAESGSEIHAHDLHSCDANPITATRIRDLLSKGDVASANQLLARPYFFVGIVQAGRGEGSSMGFSTANLVLDPMMQALSDGVYAAWAIVDGLRYKAAVSVGVAPTFANEATATCEVHLLDFDRDIYGKTIRVEFHEWLRPMMTFASVEELIDTVQGNIAWVRENLH